MFWGTPSQPGSLCNMREYISHKQVDKEARRVSNAHIQVSPPSQSVLSARCCLSILRNHTATLEWLQQKAKNLVQQCLQPYQSEDPIYHLHRSFLQAAFQYIDLRYAIRWEDGPQVIRHWKLWLPRFLGTGCKNHSMGAVELLSNIIHANFPRNIAYIALHNRTVNLDGKPGRGKPLDFMMEHYNKHNKLVHSTIFTIIII